MRIRVSDVLDLLTAGLFFELILDKMPDLEREDIVAAISDAARGMIWLDAHLSPRLARWIREAPGEKAVALRELGLRYAEDSEILDRARRNGAILQTEDTDFAELVSQWGPPPTVIGLRGGNISEERLKEILSVHLPDAMDSLKFGEPLVEIS